VRTPRAYCAKRNSRGEAERRGCRADQQLADAIERGGNITTIFD
jgi:hypothetical protein